MLKMKIVKKLQTLLQLYNFKLAPQQLYVHAQLTSLRKAPWGQGNMGAMWEKTTVVWPLFSLNTARICIFDFTDKNTNSIIPIY